MRFANVQVLALGLAVSALCAAEPQIRVPEAARIPDVMPPAPVPGAPLKLTPELLFVVDSDVDVLVLVSPAGLIDYTQESGPVKIRGRFIDDPAKVQTRTFKGKQVYTLEGIASGRCEALVVPVGATDAKQVIRRTVDVEMGQGPQPTPKPPEPKPPTPEPVASFKVIFVYESSAPLTPATQKVMFGQQVSTYLDAKTTNKGWRRYDKDVDAANEKDVTIKAAWQVTRPKLTAIPCVVIVVNQKIDILPMPTTEAEALELFKKYRGE